MAETTGESDMGIGLGMLFGFVALLGAVGMTGSGYLAALNKSKTLQLVSGVFLTVAVLAGGIAIAAIHLYE